jgi:hypothetical protein
MYIDRNRKRCWLRYNQSGFPATLSKSFQAQVAGARHGQALSSIFHFTHSEEPASFKTQYDHDERRFDVVAKA